jgi:D-alanyl-lipoteichoic acid acyltransferase DltB (MBOAT superfamily)
MLFNMPEFFIYFALVLSVYSVVATRKRWLVLLLAGLGFYGALLNPHVVAALAVKVTLTYFLGGWIDAVDGERTKRILLWSGIALNVLILAGMRYWSPLSVWRHRVHRALQRRRNE